MGEPKYSEKNLSQHHLSATNSTWTGVGLNREKTKILKKNVSGCQVVQHRFHILLLCHVVFSTNILSKSCMISLYAKEIFLVKSEMPDCSDLFDTI